MNIKKVWTLTLDHVGGFGIMWGFVCVLFTTALWRNWSHSGALKFSVGLWITSYFMVRAERIKNKRIEKARETLYSVWEKLTPEQADAIRKGLNE
jgi:hypothetical protein